MYYIELILTTNCNQDCYYCNIFNEHKIVEVDLNYLDYVLINLPDNCGVEITGGEIGLISNIDEVILKILQSNKIKHTTVLSNGLIKFKSDLWKECDEYWEHLIFDIDEKEIKKFYDLNLDENHKYIIVTTETTTKSILNNWDHFNNLGLFKKNFFYKLMNGKTHTIKNYTKELFELYGKLKDKYCLDMLMHFSTNGKFMKKEKQLCMINTPNPFIDFETKQLGHCAIFHPDSQTVPFSSKNVKDLTDRVLFDNFKCCSKCYCFDNGKDRETTNRSYQK